jgi:drug/metabolite transporter (DMT)-like permease
MELWFWAAVGGGVFAGFSNFCFKVAAKRSYNAETFTLVGGVVSVIVVSVYVWLLGQTLSGYGWLGPLTVAAGAIAACGGVMKVYALRNIDTTIFFPLFKILSPLLTLIFGLIFFAETHSALEWLGLLLGLTVPLMLINRVENGRQNNLLLGLLFVILISLTSSVAAALNKFAIDLAMPVAVTLWFASVGVALGSVFAIMLKSAGKFNVRELINALDKGLVVYSGTRAVLICVSLGLILFAYVDGDLGVVQTIHSMYILIPIILSIIFYNEHWNIQKVLAIILSIAALALLG